MSRLAEPEPFLWDIADREPCAWVDAIGANGEPSGWSYRESKAALEFRQKLQAEMARTKIHFTPGQIETLRRARP